MEVRLGRGASVWKDGRTNFIVGYGHDYGLRRRASRRCGQEAGALGWALSAEAQARLIEAQQLVDRHLKHLGVAGE